MENTEMKGALTGDEPATTTETLSEVDDPIDQTVEETKTNEEAKTNADDDDEKIDEGLGDTTDAQDEIDYRATGVFLDKVNISQLKIMELAEHGGVRARLILKSHVHASIKKHGWKTQNGIIKIIECHTDWEDLKKKGVLQDDDQPAQWFNDPANQRFNPGEAVAVADDAFFKYRTFWVIDGNNRITSIKQLIKDGYDLPEILNSECVLLPLTVEDKEVILMIQVRLL
jgi:hypothetical protein